VTEYDPAKTGKYIYPSDIFQFSKLCLLQNIFEGYIILAQNYARIFVLGHYLFLKAHSFPQAMLSENCLILRTDNVRRQISVHIFAPNGGHCLFIPTACIAVVSG